MIASQKASISLQLTLEIRNKVIEAYQEMMRMQI
jgi:flagellar hook-basal body complex protein FliE